METNLANSTSDFVSNNSLSLSIEMPILLVIPDYIIPIFLLIAVYGMYHGVEISHPLYSVLFLNLIFTLCASVINISAFQMLSTEKYILLTNLMSVMCIQFHCNCWCVTSLVRYIYIIHEKWIYEKIPKVKHQSIASISLTFVFFFLLMAIIVGNSISLGKNDCSYMET